ncbi:MAG TPA: protein translocase subunit SecF [Pseudodesulfovibrio sp.]|nr:protein translocase subunit SecF [Pseudodesulfovibrio sp.]
MKSSKAITNIDFMGKRMAAFAVSGLLILVSVVSFAVRGLNFGIDFTGGTLLEVGYQKPADLSDIRSTLSKSGFSGAVVQYFGTPQDVLIRIASRGGEDQQQLSNRVLQDLRRDAGKQKVDLRRVEFIGPQVGQELTEQGGLAMLAALFGILIYVYLRFEYRFAIGSIIATVHDVIITVGIFSLFHLEFNLTVLAAVLAVIGYSLNDTIVVYDRIRENFRKIRKGAPIEVINIAVNQTLSRTIMTSFTTLLVCIALFVFGGEIIHNFSLALIIGIVVGTYSSIYIASSLALLLGVSKTDLMPVKKEGAELDNRP